MLSKNKILEMYNNDIVKPIIDTMVDDIGIDGALDYLLYGTNINNPSKGYMYNQNGEVVGLMKVIELSYDNMIKSTIPDDVRYFIEKINLSLYHDADGDRTSRTDVKYNNFIARCVKSLTINHER